MELARRPGAKFRLTKPFGGTLRGTGRGQPARRRASAGEAFGGQIHDERTRIRDEISAAEKSRPNFGCPLAPFSLSPGLSPGPNPRRDSRIRDEIRESATRLPVFATSYPNRARIIGGGDNFGREKGQLGDNPKFGAFGRAPGRSGFWLSPGPVLVVPFSGEIRILAVPWPRFGCPLAPFWLSPGQAPEARGAF